MATLEGRETREWWTASRGCVLKGLGYSCAPENPDAWWFPRLGFSALEGQNVFSTKEEAVAKAREQLAIEQASIDRRLRALEDA